jgi:hypothetical protein
MWQKADASHSTWRKVEHKYAQCKMVLLYAYANNSTKLNLIQSMTQFKSDQLKIDSALRMTQFKTIVVNTYPQYGHQCSGSAASATKQQAAVS